MTKMTGIFDRNDGYLENKYYPSICLKMTKITIIQNLNKNGHFELQDLKWFRMSSENHWKEIMVSKIIYSLTDMLNP